MRTGIDRVNYKQLLSVAVAAVLVSAVYAPIHMPFPQAMATPAAMEITNQTTCEALPEVSVEWIDNICRITSGTLLVGDGDILRVHFNVTLEIAFDAGVQLETNATLDNDGSIENDGTINIELGATIDNSGDFYNAGIIDNNGVIDTTGATLTNDGQINNDCLSTVTGTVINLQPNTHCEIVDEETCVAAGASWLGDDVCELDTILTIGDGEPGGGGDESLTIGSEITFNITSGTIVTVFVGAESVDDFVNDGGTINNHGTIRINGATVHNEEGVFNNYGHMENFDATYIGGDITTDDVFNNFGTISCDTFGCVAVSNGATFSNEESGSININHGGAVMTIFNTGLFNNFGAVNNEGGITINSGGFIQNEAVIVNDGLITNNGNIENGCEGSITGDGSITGTGGVAFDCDGDLGMISGTKFIDEDNDGEWDQDENFSEPTLEGVMICAFEESMDEPICDETDENGDYQLVDLPVDVNLEIYEEVPEGYEQTAPTDDFFDEEVDVTAEGGSYFVTLDPEEIINGLNFGNHEDDGLLYATDAGGGSLYTIDIGTGEAELVGSMDLDSAPSLAVDPTTGLMYAGTGNGDPILFAVDPTTGETFLVGDTGLGFSGIGAMAFDSEGTLYASVNLAGNGGTGSDHLATIDTSTGEADVIGPYGECEGIVVPTDGDGLCEIEGMEGLSFAPGGTLYGATNNAELYTIDVETGAATMVTTIQDEHGSEVYIASIQFASDGTLYAGTAQGVGDFGTIDTSDGIFTLIEHTFEESSLGALAFCDPSCEPPETGTISGYKFADIDGDGELDETEEFLEGVEINVISAGYDVTDSNEEGGPEYDFVDISESGTMIFPDDDFEVVPLQFEFEYYGIVYDEANIEGTGILSFGEAVEDYENAPLNATEHRNFIAPFWDDLVITEGAVYYETQGSEPDRQFIVQWQDVKHSSTSESGVTFQAILCECSSEILFQYQDVEFGIVNSAEDGDDGTDFADFGGAATVGLAGPVPEFEHEYSHNGVALEADFAILFEPEVTEYGSDTTDGEGFYSIPVLSLSTPLMVYEVVPDDYAPTLPANGAELATFEEEIWFGNMPVSTVTGLKFADDNGDGSWDEETEAGLDGVEICVTTLEIIEYEECTETDENGEFAISNVPAVQIEVSETLPDFYVQTAPDDFEEEHLSATGGVYFVDLSETNELLLFGNQLVESGSITIRKVELGSGDLLPGSAFTITPNPFTLDDSLIVLDDDDNDSDPADGIIEINGVRFHTYTMVESQVPEGYAKIVGSLSVAVHSGNTAPVVTVQNRIVEEDIEETVEVPPPQLDEDEVEDLGDNGATVNGQPVNSTNLPPAVIVPQDEEVEAPEPVIFSNTAPPNTNGSTLFTNFNIPTYPGPDQSIADQTIYAPPAIVIPKDDGSNFVLTPVIEEVFVNMTMLLTPPASTATSLTSIQSVEVEFGQGGDGIGFSFDLSSEIPEGLPEIEDIEETALFLDVDFVGNVNFSNPDAFASPPAVTVLVSRSLEGETLPDGCPDIALYLLNENTNEWEEIETPERNPGGDTADECSYIAHPEHFSKFGIGGVTGTISNVSTRPGGGGGGSRTVIVDGTFSDSYFDLNPLARIGVTAATFAAPNGQVDSEFAVGEQVQISTTIRNYQQGPQTYAFIVQVLDENGVVQSISWQAGMLDRGQEYTVGQSWTAGAAGDYQVRMYVWNGFTAPDPLSSVEVRMLQVSDTGPIESA